MTIVHIAPNAPYNDYWGYQDNLLPKYHSKLGHKVIVIITTQMHKGGNIVSVDTSDYVLNDGVRVIRKAYHQYPIKKISNIATKIDAYELLTEIRPDIVFYHGLISTTIFDVIRYKNKSNPSCVIVEDNHLDYNIGFKCNSVKDYLKREYYRLINRCSIKHISKVYGVTPWRKTYAEDYFKIPKDKTDVLIMGADDEKLNFARRSEIKNDIRKQYQISDDDFLIVTGGKIDSNKRITVLMNAVANKPGIKLLIFGNVLEDVKEVFYSTLEASSNIIYIGWIPADKVYDYFFAAELVFFPGQHSVLWEQACAAKVPCVFEKWDGMDHVNKGGNAVFVSPVTVESISTKIDELCFTTKYYDMKSIAESDNTNVFLYSNIAEKSLECVIKC